MNLDSFKFNILMYGVSLLIAFSPIGEWVLCRLNKARKLKTKEEYECLMPLFEEVYSNALRVNSNLNRGITLKIIDDITINAFAFSRTVAVTMGALETLSEDELKGVISHEFGHIANGDTKALLLSTIGNGVFSLIFVLLRLIFNVLTFIFALTNTGAYLLPKVLGHIVNFIQRIWNYIGKVILSINSRYNEFQADKFAYKMGYGGNLLEALYFLKKINMNNDMSFTDKLKSTHPHITDRIGNLEYLVYSNGIN